MTKNSWLAALLNVLWSGAGYLYVGKRKTLGVLLILSGLFSLIWVFTDPIASQLKLNVWSILASLSFLVGLAIDAYNEAKKTTKR